MELAVVHSSSVRLTSDQEDRIQRIILKTGQSRSQIIRDAIQHYLSEDRSAQSTITKLPQRETEVLEYVYAAVDKMVIKNFGDDARNDILADVTTAMGQFHA